MNRSARPLAIVLLLALALLAPLSTVAQEPDTAEAKKAAKEKAREERIQEYLQKKEERRAKREADELRKNDEAAAQKTAEDMANRKKPATAPAVADTTTPAKAATEPPKKSKKAEKGKQAKQRPASRSRLPRGLAKTHASLRVSEFGQDPSVARYLDLIESGDASAQQIAAFGNFLGQANRAQTALAYYDLALGLDDRDTTIWLNAGTLQRQTGNLRAAAGAYAEVLSLEPNHAFAHYNLGAVLDQMGEYDSAIAEYRLALTLDPTLGDPAINPQAANNEKLLVVRMQLYNERAGTVGLGLVEVPRGEIDGGK